MNSETEVLRNIYKLELLPLATSEHQFYDRRLSLSSRVKFFSSSRYIFFVSIENRIEKKAAGPTFNQAAEGTIPYSLARSVAREKVRRFARDCNVVLECICARL